MKNFKAGNHVNQGSYKSFQPDKINQEWNIDNMDMDKPITVHLNIMNIHESLKFNVHVHCHIN